MSFDKPKTQTMKRFLEKEKDRVVGLSIEGEDGVFIYTNSNEWCDDSGAGTFRGDSETDAIKKFYDRVERATDAADAADAVQAAKDFLAGN